MVQHPAVAALNHLLAREPWACERLRPFAGKTIRVSLLPLPDIGMRITSSGLLETDAAANADLTLRIPPSALPALLARDDSIVQRVEMAGDTELATAVQFVSRHLRWDVEEDLSRVVGDAAAHRLVETGRTLAAWPVEASRRFGENVAEYLQEESGTLARPGDIAAFAREVAELRDAVERLDKRIDKLAVRASE